MYLKLTHLFNRVNVLGHNSVPGTVVGDWGHNCEKSLSSQRLQSNSFMLFFSV